MHNIWPFLVILFMHLAASSDNYIHKFEGRSVNLTLIFFGSGYRQANLSGFNTFRVQIFNTASKTYYENVQFHARLISSTVIVPITIHNKKFMYYFNYTIYDKENYTIQLRISWLTGGLFDPLLNEYKEITNVTNEKFLNYSMHLDEIVYENDINLRISNNKIHRKIQKPNCTNENIHGRWVLIPEGHDCSPEYCVGSSHNVNWLNDKFNFNGRFVYVPFECNFVLYMKQDLRKCFADKKINSFSFTGDSLVREHYQNLYLLLADSFTVKLQKLKKAHILEFNSSSIPITMQYYVSSKEWKNIKHVDVNLINIPIHKLSVRGFSDKLLLDQSLMSLAFELNRSVRYRKNPSKFYYYQHPAIQREDPRVNRKDLQDYNSSKTVSPFAMMTRSRQEIMANGIENSPLKLYDQIINGLLVSDSRWSSSWDGVHYSLLMDDLDIVKKRNCSDVNKWKNGYVLTAKSGCNDNITIFQGINKCINNDIYYCKQHSYDLTNYEGGVSRMLTQIFLNAICN